MHPLDRPCGARQFPADQHSSPSKRDPRIAKSKLASARSIPWRIRAETPRSRSISCSFGPGSGVGKYLQLQGTASSHRRCNAVRLGRFFLRMTHEIQFGFDILRLVAWAGSLLRKKHKLCGCHRRWPVLARRCTPLEATCAGIISACNRLEQKVTPNKHHRGSGTHHCVSAEPAAPVGESAVPRFGIAVPRDFEQPIIGLPLPLIAQNGVGAERSA